MWGVDSLGVNLPLKDWRQTSGGGGSIHPRPLGLSDSAEPDLGQADSASSRAAF